MTKYTEYTKLYSLCRIECPCGMYFYRSNFSHHKQSKYHKQYIEKNFGFIKDPEEFEKQKLILSCRKGF